MSIVTKKRQSVSRVVEGRAHAWPSLKGDLGRSRCVGLGRSSGLALLSYQAKHPQR